MLTNFDQFISLHLMGICKREKSVFASAACDISLHLVIGKLRGEKVNSHTDCYIRVGL